MGLKAYLFTFRWGVAVAILFLSTFIYIPDNYIWGYALFPFVLAGAWSAGILLVPMVLLMGILSGMFPYEFGWELKQWYTMAFVGVWFHITSPLKVVQRNL